MKKFFFDKNDKSINLLEVLGKKQLRIITGGDDRGKKTYWRESAGKTYTESTYVKN
ncbi:hypothetical protein [Flavobacterium sp. ABG]|uniref:hypothetical protein n=1 Tax=Flavobacterium sp. ABG TaxID=1423322 RepID=UPI0013F482C0|nr:hypothetical protein [Flavobacterium sp. ABG]